MEGYNYSAAEFAAWQQLQKKFSPDKNGFGEHEQLESSIDQIAGKIKYTPVMQRVQHLRDNWQQQGLPADWMEMHGTGFWMKPAMDSLPQNFTLANAKNWAEIQQGDVQGYTLEYIAKKGVFPILYTLNKEGTDSVLRAPMYDNKKLLDVIDPRERDGALVEALKKMQDFFTNTKTPDNSLVIITSPMGPSGLPDPKTGKEIKFPDCQTYCLQKKGNQIVGMTLRLSSSHKEDREFIQQVSGVVIPENAPLSDYVRTVACLYPSESSVQDFYDIVALRKEINGTNNAFIDEKNDIVVSWEEVTKDVKKVYENQLWDFPGKTEKYFQDYKDFVSLLAREGEKYPFASTERWFIRKLLQEGLAATFYEIAQYLQTEKKKEQLRRSGDITALSHIADRVTLGSTFKAMLAAGGCSSSGDGNSLTELLTNKSGFVQSERSQLVTSAAPRFGTVSWNALGPDGKGPIKFNCDSCGKEHTRPLGGYVKKCKGGCEKEFEPC